MAKTSEGPLKVCEHGSVYCFCRHNLASAAQLQGRPKYAPAVKRSKKPKSKKSGNAEL